MDYSSLGAGAHYIPGDNAGVYPRFYMSAVEDPEATERDNAPRFKDVEYVEILRSGENKTKPVYLVTDEHRAKWAEQYEKFKKNQDTKMQGMPIEEWALLRPSQILMLRSQDIYVVEQIADWPDGRLDLLGPGSHKLRQKARETIGRSEDVFAELRAENDKMAEQIEQLTAQMEALKQPAQTPGEKRGPGRPRKE